MEMSRIKNITIVALLLINVFFISMIITGSIKQAGREKDISYAVYEACEKQGIILNTDTFVSAEDVTTYNGVRSTADEKQIAEILIGEAKALEHGGNIYTYENENGSISFRASGTLEGAFSGIVISDGKTLAEKATKLFKSLPLTVDGINENNDGSVSVYCVQNNFEIFNCPITLRFESENLVAISGRMPQNVYSSGNVTLKVNAETAIMVFLSGVKNNEAECGAINSVELGYLSAYSVFGDSSLEPVWQISTDNGSYYINAVTGAFETFGDA